MIKPKYTRNHESQLELSGEAAPPGGPAAPVGPPCLYSNISIESSTEGLTKHQLECLKATAGMLSPYHRRAAETLYSNVSRLADMAGLNYLSLITLTFQKNVKDHHEAYQHFRSFNTNFFAIHPDFGHWICVKERQTRQAIHYHLVCIVKEDIRTGFDFDKYEIWLDTDKTRRCCPTGNTYLHRLWSDLRKNVTKYGFGWIMSVEPIKSTQEAIARYVGKYISKNLGSRTENDKGARLVNYSRGWIRNSPKFQWYTDGSKEWRRKVKLFAEYTGCSDLYQLSEKFGSDWCYKHAEFIYGIDRTLTENGGCLSQPHEAPELARIAENAATRQKNLNIVQRRPASLVKKEQSKQVVHLAKLEYTAFREWLKTLPPAPF